MSDAGGNLRLMIEPSVTNQIADGAAHAGFDVPRAKDETGDAAQHDRTRAHGARFKRDHQGRFPQLVAERVSTCAKGEQFRMRGGIPIALHPVLRRDHDLIVMEQHGADRNFAVGRRRSGLRKGRFHRVGVAHLRTAHGIAASAATSAASPCRNCKVSSESPTSATMTSPSEKRPSSTASASGFCSMR